MADLLPHPDSTGDDGGAVPGHGSTEENTPRWVKVFGIIALVVALLFVTMLLTRGPHRPGHHMPSGDTAGHTSPVQHP